MVRIAQYQLQRKIPRGGRPFAKMMGIYCVDKDVCNTGFSSGKEEMGRSQMD